MSTRRIIRTERFSVSWRRGWDPVRRLCRLNWKMLISIQPRARYSLSSERHPPQPTLFLPSFLRSSTTKLKLAKGNSIFLSLSLFFSRSSYRKRLRSNCARLIRSLGWKGEGRKKKEKRNGSVGKERILTRETGMRIVHCSAEDRESPVCLSRY